MAEFPFAIRTITAREVRGETPSWYDPNASHRYVKIVNGDTGDTFMVDMQAVAELDLRNVTAEERIQLLREYASVSNRDTVSNRTTTNGGKVMDRIIRRNITAQQTNPNSEREHLPNVRPPHIAVEFRLPGVPAKFTCYYNELILQDQYFILIRDLRASSGQYLELDPGAEVSLTIPSRSIKNRQCISSGLVFVHDNKQFSVFVAPAEPVSEPVETADSFPEVNATDDGISHEELMQELESLGIDSSPDAESPDKP